MIPSRMTGSLQPVDGCICRRLKIRMRHFAAEVEEQHGDGWMAMVVLGNKAWQDLLATRGEELVREFELCGYGFGNYVEKLKPELRKLYDGIRFSTLVAKWRVGKIQSDVYFCNGCDKWVGNVCVAGGDLLREDICRFACNGDMIHRI